MDDRPFHCPKCQQERGVAIPKKCPHKGKKRTYMNGRSTLGWLKGKKIKDLSEVPPGMVIIAVSHKFKAENLIKIVPDPNEKLKRDIRHWEYIEPNGEPTKEYSGATWGSELKSGTDWYFAEPEPHIKKRLKQLRRILRSESMSYGELHELQSLAIYIDFGDVELLEAAGVPEGERN